MTISITTHEAPGCPKPDCVIMTAADSLATAVLQLTRRHRSSSMDDRPSSVEEEGVPFSIAKLRAQAGLPPLCRRPRRHHLSRKLIRHRVNARAEVLVPSRHPSCRPNAGGLSMLGGPGPVPVAAAAAVATVAGGSMHAVVTLGPWRCRSKAISQPLRGRWAPRGPRGKVPAAMRRGRARATPFPHPTAVPAAAQTPPTPPWGGSAAPPSRQCVLPPGSRHALPHSLRRQLR